METSAVQSLKLALVLATELSKDALHVYAGLAVFFVVVLALRKPVRSWLPLAVVALAAVAAELLDMRDDLATFGYWRVAASAHDVGNTVFWPAMLFVLARRTRAFQAPAPQAGNVGGGRP